MKIKKKIIINYLLVAIFPLLFAFLLINILSIRRLRIEAHKNLETTLTQVEQQFNARISEFNRVFIAVAKEINEAKEFNYNYIGELISSKEIDRLEVFDNSIKMQIGVKPTISVSKKESTAILNGYDNIILSHYPNRQRPSIFLYSNNIIIYKTISVMNSNTKSMFFSATLLIDYDYVDKLFADDDNLQIFFEKGGVVASDKINSDLKNMLANTPNKKIITFKTPDKIKHYSKKTCVYSYDSDDSINIGVFYTVSKIPQLLQLLRNVGIIAFFITIIVVLAIALYLGERITAPLIKLSHMVNDFERHFKHIPMPDKVVDEISQLQHSFSIMSENMLAYKASSDSYNTMLMGQVEEKTGELMNKVASLSRIKEFSSFTMNIDYLNEIKYVKRSVKQLMSLLGLKYIAVYTQHSNKLKKIDYFYNDADINETKIKGKIETTEKKIVNRVFHTGEFFAKSGGTVTFFAIPIYFIDQIEYCIFYIGEKRKRDFIQETMVTIRDLIAMKIYSIRTNSSKMQSDKLASIGQFASTIIHDIKNPLTTIKSAVEVLFDEDFTDEEKEKYQRVLSSEIDLLTNMLNDILDYAKGEITVFNEDVDVDGFLNELSTFYATSLRASKIKIETHLNSKIVLSIDKHKMWRSFGNIISNAIDAIESAGTITISSEKKIFDVVIKIEDTGCGIPEEIKDKVFEPFVTANKKTGTGLGLAIVKKIIEAHGGNIIFKSEKGKGTIFYIYLPL